MTRHVFRLIDPPAGQSQVLEDTLAAIDFPWWRLLPALDRDPDGAVLVRWDPNMQQGATGLFYGRTYEIHLGTRYAGWQEKVPFVFAHEVGHLVDRATLDRRSRTDLTALLHESPETYRRDDDRLNGEPYEYAHTQEHGSHWNRNGGDHYYLRLNEAYADLFVRTFAPSLWEGKHPRFTHWTDDLDAVRRLTLESSVADLPPDVNAGRWSAESIRKAVASGVIKGGTDGRFRPGEAVSREQLAVILDRLGLLDPKP